MQFVILLRTLVDCFNSKLFLTRFRGRQHDGGKGGTYMRKTFEAVTETEKGEASGKVNGGVPKSRLG